MKPPLKRYEIVTLLHEQIDPKTGKRPGHEIGYAGGAGFTLKGGVPTYWWHDRGQTWASETLDRIDATKTQFTQAVHSHEKNNERIP